MESSDILYDESQVPSYELPDPLTFENGQPVESAEDWAERRRPEILALFEHHVYGRAPARPKALDVAVTSVAKDAPFSGALRQEVTLGIETERGRQDLYLLLYRPDVPAPVPVFAALNFYGNHSIHNDPGITLSGAWMPDRESLGIEHHTATEASRGAASRRWAVKRILARGYGLATLYCGDIDPDFHDGFENGVHGLYPRDDSEGDAWSTIGAWAWGLSRVMDYLETESAVDADRVIVMGHSRLGKTALWAGATDPRFALVISNESGCGGAALSRRRFGETVARINETFPHWFCTNFKTYSHDEASLPVDQHQLIALVAPRPIYVASAEEDQWSDPRGEFLAAKAAEPVYRLWGKAGLPGTTMPPRNQSAMGTVGYHIRTGQHDVTDYDWEQYLTFADRHLS